MTAERKKLVEEIFLDAVDLPQDQRLSFVATACPDPEIAGQVNSLLEYDGTDPAALEKVVQHAAASLISGDPLIGVRLGPYRITEQLGKGGMGAVFLAVRDDQTFEKKVAVKVVKRGMDSEAVLDRFRYERRILATLDHPYISRLLDAGTTPDGRPYFMMEYVEGQPIVDYCASHQLDLRARLELFRKVCDAVSFAHQKLVVHRDLKAGNILVAADGSPKLLDFGIAKLLDPHGHIEETAPAGRMLTLNCASPEQVRGENVTTATDIYSLGLLLFELLGGQPPWALRDLSHAEAEQIICSSTAPKPSATLRAAKTQQIGHGVAWRDITGDLDNIVLMALRKDPSRRYRSIDEFSEDIRRHRVGLPVIAREDSFSYRGAKFLRRHWVLAALATLAVLGLLAGFIEANIERRRAEVRLTQMLGMANQTLLDLHTQIERQPGSTETRMRITRSTLEYLDGLAKEAGNNQEVRSTLAKAYLATGDIQGYPDDPNLGDSNGALASYREADKLLGSGEHVLRARLLWHRGVVLFKLGRVQEGVAALRKAVEDAKQSNSKEALVVQAGAYHSLAYALSPSDPEEALANSRLEMNIASRLAEREPGNLEAQNGLADSYISTGGTLLRRNRLEEALALFFKSAAILEPLVRKHPNDVMVSRDLMNSYVRIGDTLGNPARRNLGDRRGALGYYLKAQSIAQNHAAGDPMNSLARMDLIEIHWRMGAVMEKPEEIQASLDILGTAREEAVALAKGKEMSSAQLRAITIIDEYLAKRFASRGDFSAAVVNFQCSREEARALVRKDPADSTAWTLVLLNYGGLSSALAALGRREEALQTAHQALDIAQNLQISGTDRVSMAIFVPRTLMWTGATYENLVPKDASPKQRRADWLAAAENYTRASEAWQKLHGRADIFRYQAEINECIKKAAECTHKASFQRLMN